MKVRYLCIKPYNKTHNKAGRKLSALKFIILRLPVLRTEPSVSLFLPGHPIAQSDNRLDDSPLPDNRAKYGFSITNSPLANFPAIRA